MRLQGLKLVDSKLAQEVLELLAARAQPKLRCASSAARIAATSKHNQVLLEHAAQPGAASC